MDITIVIPCLNEEYYVGNLLEDLTLQSLQPKQVIVADCNSTDKTLEITSKFVRRIPLKVVTAPIRSASSARNSGARVAATDYVLFLDADTRLSEEFLEKLLKATGRGSADFISPRFKSNSIHPFDVLNVLLVNIWILWGIYVRRQVRGIGMAMLVKKEIHDKAGGYTESIKEFDDIDYCKKLNIVNCTASYNWGATVIASNRRAKKYGRLKMALQQLPDGYFLVRKLVRPLMKKLSIKKKFEE